MNLLQKIIYDYRQFGLVVLIQHTTNAVLRPVFREKKSIVYQMTVAPVPTPENVIEISKKSLEKYSIPEKDYILFLKNLEAGDRGFAYIVDNVIAGSGWIQEQGEYVFGKVGRLRILRNMAILKNLFVYPQYRGRGIAAKLNQGQLAAIPQKTAVVFIIPENRYAIKNWIKFGMKPYLSISMSSFLHGKWKLRSKLLDRDSDDLNIQKNLFTHQ